jgi:hypothetical protein
MALPPFKKVTTGYATTITVGGGGGGGGAGGHGALGGGGSAGGGLGGWAPLPYYPGGAPISTPVPYKITTSEWKLGYSIEVVVALAGKEYRAERPLMAGDTEPNKKIIAECFEDIIKQVYADL